MTGPEADVPALATSLDGRRFSFQASLDGLALEPGSYVVIEDEDGSRVGQVVSLELAHGASSGGGPSVRHATGRGRLLEGPGTSFHDAAVRPATPGEVAAHVETSPQRGAAIELGELLLAPGVPMALDAGGFGRHTFLCGQSGSGKTYSLGVVLERLLLETGLRIVVLDPNSDFVRLGELRVDAEGADATRFGRLQDDIAVRTAGAGLAVRMRELDAQLQAALLRLDPVADREEYGELVSLVEDDEPISFERLELLRAEGGEAAKQLLSRARNLGVLGWQLWAGPEGHSLTSDLNGGPRCLVVDLGSLATREEQALAAAAVLETLWDRRAERQPVLIVVDEAHNVCPARPEDPLTAIATEHAVRIAGEGRKFGLYLLVSTQRPQKVHENVLSQCDNLLLMRMNSLGDLAYVGETFSFVPPGLLERATEFRQGEALAAGVFAPHPAYVRIGRRLTAEGGGDVSADWAQPRR